PRRARRSFRPSLRHRSHTMISEPAPTAPDPRAAGDAAERIRRQTEINLSYFALFPEFIDSRLADLDDELDVERALDATSSTLSLAGLALGVAISRRWLLLPITVQAFFLQHAMQGWCPPLPLMR